MRYNKYNRNQHYKLKFINRIRRGDYTKLWEHQIDDVKRDVTIKKVCTNQPYIGILSTTRQPCSCDSCTRLRKICISRADRRRYDSYADDMANLGLHPKYRKTIKLL